MIGNWFKDLEDNIFVARYVENKSSLTIYFYRGTCIGDSGDHHPGARPHVKIKNFRSNPEKIISALSNARFCGCFLCREDIVFDVLRRDSIRFNTRYLKFIDAYAAFIIKEFDGVRHGV